MKNMEYARCITYFLQPQSINPAPCHVTYKGNTAQALVNILYFPEKLSLGFFAWFIDRKLENSI
jgi:hypothetical protein